jgi:ribosomal protein S18 acetylase RimI-like enzyme
MRPARPDDYTAFLHFWSELGLLQAPPTAEQWQARFAPSTMFLEAETGELAAYALCFPYGARGDVRQIVVDPAWRRRGVGRRIMDEVAARLRAAGCRDWRLEVRADNTGAIALYESVGMRRHRTTRDIRLPAAAIERFAGPRSARWTARRATPDEDAALEVRFDLGTGELARWRVGRPEAVLWQLLDQGTPIGLTRYWPDYLPDCALCFPFHAPDPHSAAHLLAGVLRDTPTPAHLEIPVFDEAVADAMVAAGGHVREVSYEMAGSLEI